MASYNKFYDFTEQQNRGVHNFGSHVYKLALTNTAPVATQVSFDAITDHPPPASANGYTAGGGVVTIGISETTGTTTVTGGKVTFTASGGDIGPFRYAILYNDSATSPVDALVAWWDYGSSLTLHDGDSVSAKFNNLDTGTVFTEV